MATADDAAAVLAVYAPYVESSPASFETHPPAEDVMRERIRSVMPRYPWLVAQREGRIVGYAYGGAYRTRPAYRWTVETSVYIAADAHRTGVGRALYDVLLEGLTRQGYVTALAGVTLPNDGSIALHESFGFQRLGTMPRVGLKFGQWRDVGWWYRDLVTPAPVDPPPPVDAKAAWYARVS